MGDEEGEGRAAPAFLPVDDSVPGTGAKRVYMDVAATPLWAHDKPPATSQL